MPSPTEPAASDQPKNTEDDHSATAQPDSPSAAAQTDSTTPDIDEFLGFADKEIDERAVVADKEGVSKSTRVETYDLEPARDEVRKHIAYWLLGILTLVVAATLAMLATARWTHVTTADVRSIVELIFAPVVTLISAVTGFYYASNVQRGTQPYVSAKQKTKKKGDSTPA